MDSLLAEVMRKLKEREDKCVDVSYNESLTPPSEKLFLSHGRVNLTNFTIGLLKELYSMNKADNWVDWILKGLSYDVKFRFNVTDQMVNFIPRHMILDWPVLFVLNGDSPIIASYNKSITRTELAAFPDKSVLVKYYRQLITDEGLEICNYKQIIIKNRTEENCIWQEL
ncbi:PduM family microcompartment protein [Lactobacillus sp. 3B(2020)]|uniref:PduM family microcompartment protein n=1 Tax=Lactobacillus sp. 3B(2020) TaxID=2695882 RepID=UPI0015DDA53F|nr:PduM family microcompartment protein [Lactobacillus sp. 3B(2020)]QLL69152.1 PduM family microcompartment protein [Lactobacillus sp. 3B(2020)]